MKPETIDSSRRKYDAEFKQEALKMIDSGQCVRATAIALGISENLLQTWKQARNSNRSGPEAENADLKAQLRQMETEREILKKALIIFSRQT